MRKLLFPLLVLLSSLSTACVVHERAVVVAPPPRPPGCYRAVWIEGHYGPRGWWHPGHWRCV